MKIGDIALLKTKNDVTKEDFDAYKELVTCFPFITCMRSTVLENHRVTASVLTSSDVALLEGIGIDTNADLAKTDTSLVVDKSVSRVSSASNTELPTQSTDLYAKRATIWKTTADLISSYQSSNRGQS